MDSSSEQHTLGHDRPPVHLIGFPMDLGADRRGVDMGPSALRIAEIDNRIRRLGYEVFDEGDVPVSRQEVLKVENQKLKYLPQIAESCDNLARTVKRVLDNDGFPLILGGDHSMSIGTIAGLAGHCREQGKRLGVIWIDAHSDINTSDTSPSGNIHGMPVAVSIGMGATELTSVGGDFRKLDPENIVMIGLRSVDLGEKQIIHERNMRAYTMTDVDRLRIDTIVEESLDYLQERVDHIHVSFDLDSIDPSLAPGVGTPVPGGLTYREAHLAMEIIAERGALSSLEVAEVNPILDVKNQSAQFAAELVASVMGKRIL